MADGEDNSPQPEHENDEGINDPLTRSDVEAPQKDWQQGGPPGGRQGADDDQQA